MELIFVDLETTGLSPKRHTIVEIGAVAVDALALAPVPGVEPFQATIYTTRFDWDFADKPALEMHMGTGLYERSRLPSAIMREDAEQRFAAWLQARPERRIMAGDSVHFDRAFLAEHMPGIVDLFYHRQVDVSTLAMLMRAWDGPAPDVAGPNHHEALADCYASIEKLKHYRGLFNI